ncbi:MAG: pseudouridine synthase, partial [Spirochaetia bacterium]|nr:pseudouridine synthase [Spirochaetia bacterium]
MKMKNRGLNLQDNSENNGLIRLQVFLSHCGVASRRASEQIILDSRVSVNGKIITSLGTKVSYDDEVLVDGKRIFPEEKKRYILMYKPKGYVCSSKDERGRLCALDLLSEKYSERLYNVGRLDMFSQGLLIFTNDGDFTSKLSHPSSELEKEYIVDSSQDLPDDLAEKFEKGIRVEGVFYKCKQAQKIKPRRMRVILIEGKNREI